MRKDSTFLMEKTPLIARSLEKELFINASPERVFRALTEKEETENQHPTSKEGFSLEGSSAAATTPLLS